MNTLSFNSPIGWIIFIEENNLITSVKFGKKKIKANQILIKLKK